MDPTTGTSSTEESATFDDWRASIARSFLHMEVLPTQNPVPAFHASVARRQLGLRSLSLVRAEAHIAARTERNIMLHPADYYKSRYQLSGSTVATQDGRRATLTPGDIAVYDNSRPYELEFAVFNESVVTQVPRSEITVRSYRVERLTARTFTGTAGLPQTLGFLICDFAVGRAHGDSTASYHVARSISELITATIIAEGGNADASPPAGAVLFASMKRYARAHLSNPELKIWDVAAAHYVSARTAQRIFQGEARTFVQWILIERLKRAH